MQIDLSRFRQTFFEEAAEHLTSMETDLLHLEEDPEDRECLHRIFRCAHSIKGGSGTFGLPDIARFTHHLESLLDRMRDGALAPTRDRIGLLLRSADILRALLAAATDGAPLPGEMDAVIAALAAALGAGKDPAPAAASATVAAAPAETVWHIEFAPDPDLFRLGLDPVLVIRDLSSLGQVECQADLSALPPLAELDPERCHLAFRCRLTTARRVEEIRGIFAFVEDSSRLSIVAEGAEPVPAAPPVGCEPARAAAPAAGAPRPVPRETSIRVATDKVDRIINLVGELVIAQSMVTQAIHGLTPERLSLLQEAVGHMERNTRELQERVMAVRMVPIGSVFHRFPRMVRDLSEVLGKKVVLDMVGEETELDKGVIEAIGDPLTHLVRNSVDHGIEMPEQRARAGKPEQGTIQLRAFQQGGSVLIEVKDDGAGLDTDRIRRKGIERGLISAGQDLDEAEIHALIFAPGFSTADKITDISGRGVGLDVVKRNVDALGGAVSILTEPGKGTCFRIRLPLTLAILDGLSLSVGDGIYILPLVSIVESLRPSPQQIRTVLGRGEVVTLRGESMPLVRLHGAFNLPARITDPCSGLVVVVEHEGRRFGLLVDELLGQSQVVFKNLEHNFRKVEGLTGATIMGDGRVALILDVAGLARLAGRRPPVSEAPAAASLPAGSKVLEGVS